MEMSFPGRYTGRIKCWWPPSCNDREESHIPRELARSLEQSLISCCTLCCPTHQNAQLHNQSVLHQAGSHRSTEPNHQLHLQPTPQQPNSQPLSWEHTERSLTRRGRSLSSHTALPTPPAEQRLHSEGTGHQRKVVHPLSPALLCYSRSRSSADKLATKSCQIPWGCSQNTCTSTAAAAELAQAGGTVAAKGHSK